MSKPLGRIWRPFDLNVEEMSGLDQLFRYSGKITNGVPSVFFTKTYCTRKNFTITLLMQDMLKIMLGGLKCLKNRR